MLADFITGLRAVHIPVSVTEYLSLLAALQRRVAGFRVEDFYFVARAILVKDERHFDRYDQVFTAYVRKCEDRALDLVADLPADWLDPRIEPRWTEEELRAIRARGGWEELMRGLRERINEQRERHEGGSNWIGTGGTSPYGGHGYNPLGVRIGPQTGRHGNAVKVWERREYRNLDDDVELGTRNLKVALRKLRRFARQGAAQELDLDATISSTARNAGWLDIRLVPERRNAVKILLFFDVGGSMDPWVRQCEELFSAARCEFRHMQYYYFHNCIYSHVWRDNRRRHSETTPLVEILRTYSADHKVIIVGDATMSSYEITVPGGSVEHWNREAGEVWMGRLLEAYPRAIWLNPVPQRYWQRTPSTELIRGLMAERMFPLTLSGLEDGIAHLKGSRSRH